MVWVIASVMWQLGRVAFEGGLTAVCAISLSPLKEEHDDEDDWNPCKAAGVCLMLMASCCEDDMIAHSLPFVRENIKHPDWRYRDAAVMTFGEHRTRFALCL